MTIARRSLLQGGAALLANLALSLVFSFVLIGRGPVPAAVWPRPCVSVFLWVS
jgi:hypothetical protein